MVAFVCFADGRREAVKIGSDELLLVVPEHEEQSHEPYCGKAYCACFLSKCHKHKGEEKHKHRPYDAHNIGIDRLSELAVYPGAVGGLFYLAIKAC